MYLPLYVVRTDLKGGLDRKFMFIFCVGIVHIHFFNYVFRSFFYNLPMHPMHLLDARKGIRS